MANVATIIAMEPTYLPYERPPQPATLWTAIPRGLRGFIVPAGTLDAKPINDTQTFSLTGTLPANFAYVWSEIAVQMNQDKAGSWTGNFQWNLQSFYQGNTALSMTWAAEFANFGLGTPSPARAMGRLPPEGPKGPIWAPTQSSGILINITSHTDAAAAALAGTIDAYINFWEFDLEQARKFPVNAPIPVHSR